MSRKYTQTKRIENSYSAYKRDWYSWKVKGYAMKTDAPLSFEDYKDMYKMAKLAKIDKIASSLAKEGRVVSHEEARMISQVIKKTGDERFKDFTSLKKIKKDINRVQFEYGNTTYYGRQALYLSFKVYQGDLLADELFGY